MAQEADSLGAHGGMSGVILMLAPGSDSVDAHGGMSCDESGAAQRADSECSRQDERSESGVCAVGLSGCSRRDELCGVWRGAWSRLVLLTA